MNSATAIYTFGIGETSAVLTWTIIGLSNSTGGCTTTTIGSGEVVVSIGNNPTSEAGGDLNGEITVCEGTTTVQLGASGTGSWSGGTGSFDNVNSSTAIYTLGGGETSAVLTWTVSSGNSCPSASDIVTVNVSTAPTMDAGPDMIVCEGTTSVQLSALGTGTWSGGTGTVSYTHLTLPTICSV